MTTPTETKTTAPEAGSTISLETDDQARLDDTLAADMEAAFTEPEPEPEPEPAGTAEKIERPDGTALAIMSEDEFFQEVFQVTFNGPQHVIPALHHIAIDNGQPFRPEAARATSNRVYRYCRSSGVRWLENLLSIDRSGVAKIIDLGLVAWFGLGTAHGGWLALAEIAAMGQEGDQDEGDQAPPEPDVPPGTPTHLIAKQRRAG